MTHQKVEAIMRFVDKRVIILGGTSGIGLAVAHAALDEGASVIISSNREESVVRARAELATASGSRSSAAVVVDVSNEDAIKTFFSGVEPFDHLVFTAGEDLPLGTLANTDIGVAQGRFQIRFWGALAAVKYGVTSMRRGGSIVLTSGFSAGRPRSGWTSQASIQSAVEGLTRALAVELAPLRVNAVSPGLAETPRWAAMVASNREALFKSEAERLPLARLGRADEIATAYLYLMQNSYATGTVVIVDGGGAIV